MALTGYTTKTDLTKLGSLLFMGLIGIIIASVVNFFIGSSLMHYIISIIGVLVFTGLTAYDVQKIKNIGSQVQEGSESGQKLMIMGALTLYLDFINLFLMMLSYLEIEIKKFYESIRISWSRSPIPRNGKRFIESHNSSRKLFELSNEILGFNISEIMFNGSEQDLKQTRDTQPAIFLHSVILAKSLGENFKPDVVAGHSLGEISALVANECLKFEDGLELVYKRALAMQKACEETPSTMAAIIGLEDSIVEKVCGEISGIVVPANYNCPGQLVISGEINAIDLAIEKLTEKGARRALKLPVGGAFHSPIMETAKDELSKAINSTYFSNPICPIFQNVSAEAVNNPDQIKENLIEQLTSPVKWTQTMLNMLNNKNLEIIEVGPGKVLQGLFKKIDRSIPTSSAVIL